MADCLWNAGTMSTTRVNRSLGPVRGQLQAHGLTLNASQWQAWEEALTHRARLIWGPPGTGKSRTARAVVLGAVLEAQQNGQPLRVLVSAFTYTAIDNVLYEIAQDISVLLPQVCDVFRLRSAYAQAPANPGTMIDLEVNRSNPSQGVRSLRATLRAGNSIVVVGATPEQSHNLLTCEDDSAQAEWFDLIVIDEASQMDVAHAVFAVLRLGERGCRSIGWRPAAVSPDPQGIATDGPRRTRGLGLCVSGRNPTRFVTAPWRSTTGRTTRLSRSFARPDTRPPCEASPRISQLTWYRHCHNRLGLNGHKAWSGVQSGRDY